MRRKMVEEMGQGMEGEMGGVSVDGGLLRYRKSCSK